MIIPRRESVDPQEPFGVQLRVLRQRAGLTQEELAERADLSAQAVSALERGVRNHPYPSTVRSLADALNASPREQASLLAVSRRPREPDGDTSDAAVGLPPLPLTALVGREADVTKVTALLHQPECRLITLTGTGGVGKTRLSVAVAHQVAHEFADGVVFVELASVRDAALVLPHLARGIGLGAPEAPDVGRALAEHLRHRRVLLILDNFEHLVAAAVPVSRLIAACPGAKVLVASRAPLRVNGEIEYPVMPLGLPAPGPGVTVDTITEAPAVKLFVERAQAHAPDFGLSEHNAAAVAAICRELSGIPLALEIAAARIPLMDAGLLLTRLGDAMSLGGARDLPQRQRTMKVTLDWSHDLLPRAAQRLFRHLAVFSGGFTLDAAEAVAAGPADDSVLGSLEHLVDHSLVTVIAHAGRPPRYQLLEPIAQYARARLSAGPDPHQAGHAHAAYFLALAERAAPEYQRADQVRWLARTEAEDGNLATAITWALENGQPETAARLGWSLWLYWWIRGRLILGRGLLEAVLEQPLTASLRSRARSAAGALAFAQGDLAAAGRLWRQASEDARAAGDIVALAHAQPGEGLVALAGGDPETAADLFRSAIEPARQAGPDGAWVGALIHVWLGTAVMVMDGPAAAEAPIRQGLASARARGDRLTTFVALFNLSQAAIGQGEHETARGHLEEGIRLSEQVRDFANLAYFLDALAVVEDTTAGDPGRVATLLGAARSLRETAGADVYGYYLPDESLREGAATRARARLGERRHADAVAAGRAMTLEEVTAYATSPADAEPPPRPARGRGPGLTDG